MQLFYNPDISQTDTRVTFPKDESRHIVKVLRKKVGDKIHITNGKGFLFVTELNSADIKNCEANIIVTDFKDPPLYHLHLAVAPTKMNDRFEWFLEKATEIGVTEITPIICDNSERKTIKQERFERILQSALKQSLRYYLPKLHPAMTFREFLGRNLESQKLIAHCEETYKTSLKSQIQPRGSTVILIGPEGDFSPQEIEQAKKINYTPVSLGDHRLRTETAAIVACHTVVLANQS